jgi:hypothetical protein
MKERPLGASPSDLSSPFQAIALAEPFIQILRPAEFVLTPNRRRVVI